MKFKKGRKSYEGDKVRNVNSMSIPVMVSHRSFHNPQYVSMWPVTMCEKSGARQYNKTKINIITSNTVLTNAGNIPCGLSMAVANICSVKSKELILVHEIHHQCLDLVLITETWLSDLLEDYYIFRRLDGISSDDFSKHLNDHMPVDFDGIIVMCLHLRKT